MKHLFNTTNHLSKRQIQDYLNENLNPEERFQVENHLLDSPLAAAAVEGYEKMGFTEEDMLFLEKFKAETEAPAKAQTIVKQLEPRNNRFVLRRIAAAVALLLIPLSMFLFNSNPSMDELYQENFEAYTLNKDFRGEQNETTTSETLQKVLDQYQNSNYAASIPLFETYLSQVENSEMRLGAAVANLETGNYQKATNLLMAVRQNDERHFENATWYLILTKLKTEQKAEAIDLLEDLLKKNPKGYYTTKAKSLLKKLT